MCVVASQIVIIFMWVFIIHSSDAILFSTTPFPGIKWAPFPEGKASAHINLECFIHSCACWRDKGQRPSIVSHIFSGFKILVLRGYNSNSLKTVICQHIYTYPHWGLSASQFYKRTISTDAKVSLFMPVVSPGWLYYMRPYRALNTIVSITSNLKK